MAGSFFANAKHFTITGGEFNEINGNKNVRNTTIVSATAGSHNRGTEGAAWAHRNAGQGSQFRPAPSNTYPQQGAPGRTQTYSSAFMANPRVFNNPNGGGASRAAQSSVSMRALPYMRIPRPGDEIAAQIQRNERTRLPPAMPQQWQESYRSDPPREYHREPVAPPWHVPAAHSSLPIPMLGPGNSSRYNPEDDMFSASPEDGEGPSWPHSTSIPHHLRCAPNMHPCSPTAPLYPAVARSISRTTRLPPRDDNGSSSESDSEDEDMVPTTRRRDSQTGWISDAKSH